MQITFSGRLAGMNTQNGTPPWLTCSREYSEATPQGISTGGALGPGVALSQISWAPDFNCDAGQALTSKFFTLVDRNSNPNS